MIRPAWCIALSEAGIEALWRRSRPCRRRSRACRSSWRSAGHAPCARCTVRKRCSSRRASALVSELRTSGDRCTSGSRSVPGQVKSCTLGAQLPEDTASLVVGALLPLCGVALNERARKVGGRDQPELAIGVQEPWHEEAMGQRRLHLLVRGDLSVHVLVLHAAGPDHDVAVAMVQTKHVPLDESPAVIDDERRPGEPPVDGLLGAPDLEIVSLALRSSVRTCDLAPD